MVKISSSEKSLLFKRKITTGTRLLFKSAFTLIELLVSAACKTGVLYNRCGMLSWWGGALKTDKNGQKRTKTDKNGQKRTKTDKNGQKRISVRRRIRLVSPNNKTPRFF